MIGADLWRIKNKIYRAKYVSVVAYRLTGASAGKGTGRQLSIAPSVVVDQCLAYEPECEEHV